MIAGVAQPAELAALADDEAALMYHVQRFGSAGYPVDRSGRGWVVRDWRSVKGSPVVHRTKRAAIGAFEAWYGLALDRWRAMRLANPGASMILTAEGVKVLP